MALKFINNIIPFQNNDQVKWRLFYDDVANQFVIFDDNADAEIARIPSGGGGDTFESGTFTLSEDGSVAQVGMNGNPLASVNHKIKFNVAGSMVGVLIGETITNLSNGATCIITEIVGNLITADTITGAGAWVNGDNIHYENLDANSSIDNDPIWILTIPTSKRLKLIETIVKNIQV